MSRRLEIEDRASLPGSLHSGRKKSVSQTAVRSTSARDFRNLSPKEVAVSDPHRLHFCEICEQRFRLCRISPVALLVGNDLMLPRRVPLTLNNARLGLR